MKRVFLSDRNFLWLNAGVWESKDGIATKKRIPRYISSETKGIATDKRNPCYISSVTKRIATNKSPPVIQTLQKRKHMLT